MDCAWHAYRGVCPELPVPAIAWHSCQADPGQPAHLGRSAWPDWRPLFCAFLLLHLNSCRVARGQDEQVESFGSRMCNLERGNHVLRRRGQLFAICHRVHDGRLRRSRRRSTLLLDHLRLFFARPSRQSAGPLQHRTADWCSAGNRLRRFHRCCFQLAVCICPARLPRSIRSDRRPLSGA